MLKRLAAIILLFTSSHAEAEVPYIDNRSTAQDVVVSLYNAINRKEYARAWSYFSQGPAKSYADYAKGFADTQSVDIEIGQVQEEGAAGSVFYTVPVALRSKDNTGAEKTFSGCYTLRKLGAAEQEPPFRPLEIEQGKLKLASEGDLMDALPSCGGGAPDRAGNDRAAAIKLFQSAFATECEKASPSAEEPVTPEVYPISFRYDYQTADEPAQEIMLFEFSCGLYAYNYSNVYIVKRASTAPEIVSFTQPSVDYKIEGEDTEKPTLKVMVIDGYMAQTTLINPEFDAKSNTISFFAKGRGIGDLSSSGTYVFREGSFVLTDFAYDATGNGETDPVDLIINGKVVEPKI